MGEFPSKIVSFKDMYLILAIVTCCKRNWWEKAIESRVEGRKKRGKLYDR
jgi:hypothetical protein